MLNNIHEDRECVSERLFMVLAYWDCCG